MARPPSDLSTRIVRAARERFLVEGVDGASLRAIAKDAGTNIGMIYYYYPTKDDLFLGVVEEVYEGLVASLAEALAPDVPPEARIERLYKRVANLSPEEFQVIRLVVREALVSSKRLVVLAERFKRGHLPLMFGLVGEGLASQRFTDEVPPIAIMAATMSFGLVSAVVRRVVVEAGLPIAATLPPADVSAEAMLRVLLHGIAGPALVRNDDPNEPSR